MMDAVASPSPQTPGAAANGVNGNPFVAIDPNVVVEHLASMLEAALGATRDELEAPGSLLSKSRYSDTVQRCTRFASDAQVSLYIQKDLASTPEVGNGNGNGESSTRMPPLHTFAFFGLY